MPGSMRTEVPFGLKHLKFFSTSFWMNIRHFPVQHERRYLADDGIGTV